MATKLLKFLIETLELKYINYDELQNSGEKLTEQENSDLNALKESLVLLDKVLELLKNSKCESSDDSSSETQSE